MHFLCSFILTIHTRRHPIPPQLSKSPQPVPFRPVGTCWKIMQFAITSRRKSGMIGNIYVCVYAYVCSEGNPRKAVQHTRNVEMRKQILRKGMALVQRQPASSQPVVTNAYCMYFRGMGLCVYVCICTVLEIAWREMCWRSSSSGNDEGSKADR
jgi:hypothetical protein